MAYGIMGYIESGVVIDHLPPNNASKLARMLKLEQGGCQYLLGYNFDSKKLRKKSFLKFEGKLNETARKVIKVFVPSSTINLIEEGKVKEKIRLQEGEILEDVVNCPNEECITHDKHVCNFHTRMRYKEERLYCENCEQNFPIGEAIIKRSALKSLGKYSPY